MYTNNPYCTLTDVKQAIDPQLGTQDDTFLSQLIIMAQADIDREVGYPFQTDGTTTAPTTKVYDGQGTDVLAIDPILWLAAAGGSPAGVVEIQRNTVLSSSTGMWQLGTVLTMDITNDVVMLPNNDQFKYMLKRISGYSFEEGLQNYRVSGVFGWPPLPGQAALPGQIYAGVPADITRATIRLAIHYYKMRDTNYADMTQETGGVRERYTKQMPIDVVEVIQRYRRRTIIGRWSG